MNLYKISQEVNTGWDTFSDAVVANRTENAARSTRLGDYGKYGSWARPKDVKVELIGIAVKGIKAGVICSSFHAGQI